MYLILFIANGNIVDDSFLVDAKKKDNLIVHFVKKSNLKKRK